ncbi:hypothetical protein HBB16_20765 [Pseudonocardia sp. MCCB 268]|nr:hypothetical protein [Pseudonocardia cytotoxica]
MDLTAALLRFTARVPARPDRSGSGRPDIHMDVEGRRYGCVAGRRRRRRRRRRCFVAGVQARSCAKSPERLRSRFRRPACGRAGRRRQYRRVAVETLEAIPGPSCTSNARHEAVSRRRSSPRDHQAAAAAGGHEHGHSSHKHGRGRRAARRGPRTGRGPRRGCRPLGRSAPTTPSIPTT